MTGQTIVEREAMKYRYVYIYKTAIDVWKPQTWWRGKAGKFRARECCATLPQPNEKPISGINCMEPCGIASILSGLMYVFCTSTVIGVTSSEIVMLRLIWAWLWKTLFPLLSKRDIVWFSCHRASSKVNRAINPTVRNSMLCNADNVVN